VCCTTIQEFFEDQTVLNLDDLKDVQMEINRIKGWVADMVPSYKYKRCIKNLIETGSLAWFLPSNTRDV
jgi:hypothetical protein